MWKSDKLSTERFNDPFDFNKIGTLRVFINWHLQQSTLQSVWHYSLHNILTETYPQNSIYCLAITGTNFQWSCKICPWQIYDKKFVAHSSKMITKIWLIAEVHVRECKSTDTYVYLIVEPVTHMWLETSVYTITLTSRSNPINVAEELALGHTGVTHQTNVDVTWTKSESIWTDTWANQEVSSSSRKWMIDTFGKWEWVDCIAAAPESLKRNFNVPKPISTLTMHTKIKHLKHANNFMRPKIVNKCSLFPKQARTTHRKLWMYVRM